MLIRYIATKSKLPVNVDRIKEGIIEAKSFKTAERRLQRSFRNILFLRSERKR